MSTFMRAASAYRDVGLKTQTAQHDQYQLVVMMFDGILESLTRAKGAMVEKDVPAKVEQITKAVRLIQEGLRTSLDLDNGGELAANLANLYDYCVLRLTQANATNNQAALDEVASLIKPVADAWKELRATGHTPSAAPSDQAAQTVGASKPGEPDASSVPPVARRVGQLYAGQMMLAGA